MTKSSSLKNLVVRGSAFELLGYGLGQVFRFGSNIVLSRLLFPEAFGLAALVWVLNQGLVMLSDIGIEQAVIQNPRGDERVFLDTAWTMHVVRAAGLWVIACLVAWPAAYFYKEPQLAGLIPVGSLVVLLQGLASTSVFTLRRQLRSGVLNAIELGVQAFGTILTIVAAYYWRSVWSLVICGVVGALARTIVTHLIRVGARNRFAWDPVVRSEIFHFGKFIFGSSALFFIGSQTDRIVLGRLVSIGMLGVYSIALNLSGVFNAVTTRITISILYPALSRVGREGVERVRSAYYRARLPLDLLGLAPLGALMSCADWTIGFLYDARYASAGWMLKLLCLRAAFVHVIAACEYTLVALGHARYGMYRNLSRLLWVIPAMLIGVKFWGLTGLLGAVVTAELPAALLLLVSFMKHRVLSVWGEVRGALIFAGGVLVGSGLNFGLTRWVPPLSQLLGHHH